MSQSAPEAARKLRGALGELQQSEASTRLQTAADYIRRGGAPYVANSEEGVSRALRDFRDNVREAEQIAQNGGAGSVGFLQARIMGRDRRRVLCHRRAERLQVVDAEVRIVPPFIADRA